jgi:hypothetical protein
MPGIFHSGFLNKSYAQLYSPCMLHTPQPHHLFDLSNNILWRIEIMILITIKSTSFLCYLTLLAPDIILSTLFWYTLNPCSSFLVNDQHRVRNKKKDLHNNTPTATATHHLAWPHCHNIGPPWLPTTPSHWKLPTLPVPRCHSEPTDPTYNGWTKSLSDACI